MMISMEMMLERANAALAYAGTRGASAAKVGVASGESLKVRFEAGRLKATGGEQTFSINVDTLADGRRGNAVCGHADDLPRAVEQAVGLAKLGSVAHFTAWPAPASVTPVPAYAESTAALSREALIDSCRTMVELLKAFDPELHITCAAQRNCGESLLVSSGGTTHRRKTTNWQCYAMVQRTNGTDMLVTGDGRGWGDSNCFFEPRAIVEKIIFQLNHAAHSTPAPSGPIKALLTPDTLRAFLWPVFMGINGRIVAKGESPLAGKLGEQILSPAFTVVDDPHLPYSIGSAEVDFDGIPTRRQTLLENGVLQCFLYDLDSAGLAKAAPTGNNFCTPYYPIVTRGTRSSGELLAAIDDGLYLTENLIGYGQSNIINGDFSCNVGLGYRIKHGKIIGRVKDVMIAGNLYNILRGNVELSADTSYDGSVPYAVVEGIIASAKPE